MSAASGLALDFHGQHALVTGGTRGIGRQIVEDLAALGATVTATGAQADGIERLNRERPLANVTWRHVDFTDRSGTEAFAGELNEYQRLDVLVNNAGINRLNAIEDCSLEDWDALNAVNLDAPFILLRAAAPVMRRARYGRIVNIASIWSVVGRSKRAMYAATKFGLRGLTAVVSNELAPFNVLVNTVSPGFVRTELTERLLPEAEQVALRGQIPAARFAEAPEISRAVIFLASSLNTYISGQNLVIDGGFTNA